MKQKSVLITAGEVAEVLQVSRNKSYQIINDLNKQMKAENPGVFCKPFLDKVAKYFWTLLHVQIGQSCKALASLGQTSRLALQTL